MTIAPRRQKEPLRALTSEERQELERISRATSESVTRVARAKALLTVAQGLSYTAAAQACGRRSGDAVAQLVERFNRAGLAALTPKHGGGAKAQYTAQQRQQFLAVAQQQPELENDGVSQWSLVTLQRRLRASGGDDICNGEYLHDWASVSGDNSFRLFPAFGEAIEIKNGR
ncbi:MAG TPA: helix-turn-helix domain containing protein [Coleofasciculaceae cyanobacterium]